MASSTVQSNKNVRRMQLRKSHSWWWDSHISPKNSKWLAENLEEMDQSIKRMLKLTEEDGDSFAKKAEMYYQKRPELVSLVEEFYRMYRSLAERYDHVTGELRKNIPSDLQSQGSSISDITSEPSSMWPSPAHDQRSSHRKSGPRAAGFDFFLGSGGSSSDLYQKEGDESSTLTDSEPESDDSSVNNYSGLFLACNDQALSRKVIELEIELRETKEKFRMQQHENGDGSFRGVRNENSEDLLTRIASYEQELKIANERIRLAEEEALRLKIELKKYNSLESMDGLHSESAPSQMKDAKTWDGDIADLNSNPQALAEQLKITKERLQSSEKEIASLKHQLDSDGPPEKISSLQDQLALAREDVNKWKTKLNAEKRGVSKLQERISRLKTSLSDRDHEIRDLNIAVSDAEQKIFPEKAQIKAEISKLLEERNSLKEQLREWESHCRVLEDETRMLQAEKAETESKLKFEIKQLKVEIAEQDQCIEILNKSLGEIKSERDEINSKVVALRAEVISRDDRIHQMDKHLHQLHMENVELIAGAENARKQEDEVRSKAKCLEKEVDRLKIAILEGAEEKREAIRQLCFSLEHYRNGYQWLRQACMGHKRLPVLAT